MTFAALTILAVVLTLLLLNLSVRRRLKAMSKPERAEEEREVNRELANW